MKIAIISDIHENIHNLVLALEEIEKKKAEKILFLGDFINNGVAKVLAASKIPVFAVWGNNDGDKVAITKTSLKEGSNMEMADEHYDSIELDGKKLFLTHYPVIAKSMAKSGDYDAVFYGHNHLKNKEKIGDCLVLNPGELSAHKTGEATYAIYDTKTNDAEIFTLKNTISLNTEKVKEAREKIGFKYSKSKGHKY